MRGLRLTGLTKVVVAATTVFTLAATIDADASAAANHRRLHHVQHRHLASTSAHVIQCVVFARAASDVAIIGNAANWWHKAAGIYARGTAPEVGSVLNFRANSRMRLGHVAVVTQIVDSRTIRIDQSHWHANGISRDVSVIDVSQNNDWSAVRVAIGRDGTFGSIYPTYGFIYARPDTSGRIITARSDSAPPRTLNGAPSDLRAADAEVAEAPGPATGLDLTSELVAEDAPNRSLR